MIDGASALVGSANLTARALHHNPEVGVLTHDPELATAPEQHLRALMTTGVLVAEGHS